MGHHLFEYNIILSRFLNWPDTLKEIGYRRAHTPDTLGAALKAMATRGKIWGGAYIITTHGIPMGKVEYLCNNVLESAYSRLDAIRGIARGGNCRQLWQALQRIEGVGSFLAAQIVADLKNTVGHPLTQAEDWWTFVAPGPGSLRGASWFHYGKPEGVTVSNFHGHFDKIQRYVDSKLTSCSCDENDMSCPHEAIFLCNQDLQNALCEFDKYCRVKTGTGRSKRGYKGI